MEGDLVALRGHKVQISSEESAALRRLEQEFRKAAYQPSPPNEILRSAAVEAKNGRALLERLIKDGKLVRVSENLVFHADVLAHIRKSLAAHKGRRFSVPEFKDWTQISRKFAIPLLEYLDHQHVTRREGDNRVVL
jgi:selenocysteine-specific elongation factor